MPFQTTVNIQMGAGVVGELYNDSPRRAQSFILNSASAANNVFGRCFTKTAEGIAQAGSGGTLGFAGFLINPKGSALFGVSGNNLGATITLANYAQGELLTMGSIWVNLPAPASIGDLVVYDNTTGDLTTISPGAALPVGKSFAYATVNHFTVTAAGLAVVTVSPTLTIPV